MSEEKYNRCLLACGRDHLFTSKSQLDEQAWSGLDRAYALAGLGGEEDAILTRFRERYLRLLVLNQPSPGPLRPSPA